MIDWTPADWPNQEPDTAAITFGLNLISGEVARELYNAICYKVSLLEEVTTYRLEVGDCIMDVSFDDGHILLNIEMEIDPLVVEITPMGIALYGDVPDIDDTVAARVYNIIINLIYHIDDLQPAINANDEYSLDTMSYHDSAYCSSDWSELLLASHESERVLNESELLRNSIEHIDLS